jgi:hypothetical protein
MADEEAVAQIQKNGRRTWKNSSAVRLILPTLM